MQLFLNKSKINVTSSIKITGSKSESNRILMLQALFEGLTIKNLSNSDDSILMQKAIGSESDEIDIHHAGTAMRFLTAFFAAKAGRKTTLTGSKRMQERPIKILVEALRTLGADISYLKNEGYPPLQIIGKPITKHQVELDANISSQYISALLLIGPTLPKGLELRLVGTITSLPYINMTLSLLHELGVKTTFKENLIVIDPHKEIANKTFTVESDWSSASYFYSIVALSPLGTEIKLSSYKKTSLQGDASLQEIYKNFGVESRFHGTTLSLIKTNTHSPKNLKLDLSDSPDIAQTIVVSCLGLKIDCELIGLHTLKIKETDRLVALKNEIKKLGTNLVITDHSLCLKSSNDLIPNVTIATYNDHRMAMAFAPLAIKTPLSIENAEVVSKSYPDFWRDLTSLGFDINQK